jgi:hypothetical protein
MGIEVSAKNFLEKSNRTTMGIKSFSPKTV